MNKSKLMIQVKNKFGGEYLKENGRWYWSNNSDKVLVTGGWLLKKLSESTAPIVEEVKQEPAKEEPKPAPKKSPPKKKKEPEPQ